MNTGLGILHFGRRLTQAPLFASWRRAAALGTVVLCVLSACSTPPDRTRTDDRYVETRAQRLAESGRFEQAARLYEQIAVRHELADRYWLDAASQWHAAEEWARVERALNRIEGSLEPEQALRRALLGTSAALAQGAPDRAINWLDTAPEQFPDRARPAYLWLQVRLALAQGNVSKALSLNDEREMWLENAESIRLGRRALLDALSRDLRTPVETPPAEQDRVLAGWLELAKIQSGADRDPFVVRAALRAWEQQYREHPAAVLLPELQAEYRQLLDYPQRLAVMLPLTGRFATAGEAVRDGILAAYLRQGAERPVLSFFDTNAEDIAVLYARAIAENADFVLGPLTREALEAMAQQTDLGVPTLALNNLTDGSPLPGIFQFGLTPEDEARQAAQRIIDQGLVQGVALVPESGWGGRVLAAFRDQLEQSGGTLLDYQTYAPRDEDFSAPITTILHLAESRQRNRNLAGVLGRRLEFEPRRREDVQFIFLAATAETGRLMRPQLRFHYASDIPVFSTSSIYEPDPDRNRDLDGINFVDLPWLLDDSGEISALRQELSGLFPRRMKAWPRLYALGYDAYRLVPPLFSGRFTAGDEVRGLTGDLSVSADGQIRRKMRWAQFAQGVPVLLEELTSKDAAPAITSDDDETDDSNMVIEP